MEEYVIYKNQFSHPATDKPSDLDKRKGKVKNLPYSGIPESGASPGAATSSEGREQRKGQKIQVSLKDPREEETWA